MTKNITLTPEEIKNHVLAFMQWLDEKYVFIPDISISKLYDEYVVETQERDYDE